MLHRDHSLQTYTCVKCSFVWMHSHHRLNAGVIYFGWQIKHIKYACLGPRRANLKPAKTRAESETRVSK